MRLSVFRPGIQAAFALATVCGGASLGHAAVAPSNMLVQRTIVMVWDGLRPDSINAVDTPNLYALSQQGVRFADHHATYPTFTMMNAAALATGAYPRASGFYGNTLWTPPRPDAAQPLPVGKSAGGARQDYAAPVFTEDYAILSSLNDYYGGQLLLVKSLFQVAQQAGLSTVTVGKSGPAYLQDLGRRGMILDENTVFPQALANELQAARFALPANVAFAYPSGRVALAPANGNPTGRAGVLKFALPNGVLSNDATDSSQGAAEDAANKYMMKVYTDFILPKKLPDLSLIWFRTPDSTEHAYGPGSANYRRALASQDARLGELQAGLKAAGLDGSTNLIVVSDHGHSTVSGPLALFPLYSILPATSVANGVSNAKLGVRDAVSGYPMSGDVRSADLLTYAGFKAYDGAGCMTSSMFGIRADGNAMYPVRTDTSGALCGAPNTKYQAVSADLPTPVASFKLPAVLPPKAIVVAPNGGSDYFYVPDHDATTVYDMVRFLQSRTEYGAVFVDTRYGAVPGTLPLSMVNLDNAARADAGQPDVVVSFNWDAEQRVNGMPGILFESAAGNRGMHGSFSPVDVHNTLIAYGPAFRSGVTVVTPSGNVDVAPTVAHLFGQSLPQAEGRVLNEALRKPISHATPTVKIGIVNPASQATGLSFKLSSDPSGATLDSALPLGSYSIDLMMKSLTVDGKTYRYFDYAKAVRK